MIKRKSMKPALSPVFASFLVLLVSVIGVVRGQRCPPDANWEDMGRDGCVNFVAGAATNSWSGAAYACVQYESGGRYAQLLRFRDGSQNDADASFNALYAKFAQYEDALGGYVWVNIYQGSDGSSSRSPSIHVYDTWLKTSPLWTRPVSYTHLTLPTT